MKKWYKLERHNIIFISLFIFLGICLYGLSVEHNKEVQQRYKQAVATGDINLNKDELSIAKEEYQKALQYKDGNDSQVQSRIELCDKLIASKENYDNGNKKLNSDDYLGSITCFKGVSMQDKIRYDKAQALLNEAKGTYVSRQLKSAKLEEQIIHYANALEYVNNALNVSPEDTQAQALKTKIEKEKSNEEVTYQRAVQKDLNKSQKNTSTNNKSLTVYITETGHKYHRSGCRYLSRSCYSISLDGAQTRGYSPCSVCRP